MVPEANAMSGAGWDSNLHTPYGYRWDPRSSSCGEGCGPRSECNERVRFMHTEAEGRVWRMGFEPAYPLRVQVGPAIIILRRGACTPAKRGYGIRTCIPPTGAGGTRDHHPAERVGLKHATTESTDRKYIEQSNDQVHLPLWNAAE